MLTDIALEIAVGGAMWTLALAFPARAMEPNAEVRWDVAAVVCTFVFASIAGGALTWAFGGAAAMLSAWHDAVRGWPLAAVVLAYAVAADFSSYWAHRLLHTRWLWHTHAFHHSPRHVYVLSGLRASFAHIVVLFAGPILALVLFPLYEWPLLFVVIAALQAFSQHFTHSNIRVPFARPLELLLVTPRYHFVHHSKDRRFSDSNYGMLLSIWDRMFGTYTDPERVAPDEPLGIGYANSNWRLLVGLPPRRPSRNSHTAGSGSAAPF